MITLSRIFSHAVCIALFGTTAAIAQDEKAAPKSKSAETEKKDSKAVKPRDEETALKEFKADALKIKAWVDGQRDKANKNPSVGIKMISEISVKFAEVRTDGLPEDIASPFDEMKELTAEMAGYFKGMPEDPGEFQKWMTEKATSDPDFVKQLQEEMPKLGEKMEKAGEKLKTAAAKHGIDLDFNDKKSGKGGKDDEEDDDDDEKEEKDGDDKDGDDAKPEKEEEKLS